MHQLTMSVMYAIAVAFGLCQYVCALPLLLEDILNSGKQKGAMEAILDNNKGLNYFQGDIITQNSTEKNAIADEGLKWSPVIPYVIHDQYDFDTRELIADVFRELNVRLCVRFQPRENEASYLMYTRGNGCYSSVGQVGGSQVVSIGYGCETRGVVKHETLHALGFWHEQSRYDRDYWVQIKWENIQDGMAYNFDKYSKDQITTLGEEYDYSSVMHYGPTAFSSNGEATIVALHPGGEEMGQRRDMSQSDWRRVRQLYGCEVELSGWSDWTEWSECDITCMRYRKRFCEDDICPEPSETEWSECDHFCLAGYDSDCSSRISATSHGILKSPLYPYNYKPEVECIQTIVTCPGETVSLNFETVDVEHYQENCYYDWIKVYDGNNIDSPLLGVFCGSSVPQSIQSTGNSLTVLFYSDYSVTQGGFLADYTTSSSSSAVHVCHFEGEIDVCGWSHDATSDFKWFHRKGSTPTVNSGPSYDHTTMQPEGWYLYIEASNFAAGKKGRILTPVLPPAKGGHCVTFWYNMFGKDIHTLTVYQVVGNTRTAVFSEYGNHGNDDWLEGEVSVFGDTEYQIAFEGTRGSSYQGDISIDDVVILPGACDNEGSGNVIPADWPQLSQKGESYHVMDTIYKEISEVQIQNQGLP